MAAEDFVSAASLCVVATGMRTCAGTLDQSAPCPEPASFPSLVYFAGSMGPPAPPGGRSLPVMAMVLPDRALLPPSVVGSIPAELAAEPYAPAVVVVWVPPTTDGAAIRPSADLPDRLVTASNLTDLCS